MFRVMNHDVAKGKHFEIPSIYVRELSKGRDEVWLISVIEINGTSKCLMQNQSCPIVFWRVIKKGYLLLSHPFNACMLTVETYIYSTLEWPLYWLYSFGDLAGILPKICANDAKVPGFEACSLPCAEAVKWWRFAHAGIKGSRLSLPAASRVCGTMLTTLIQKSSPTEFTGTFLKLHNVFYHLIICERLL